ncbi:S8 family peptidase [Micromonospora coxensis]|uniref:Peptidase inhibitor I9 n=1 Tax=Micromonospora coxensis TaxID=356852 RepID=A0A1C5GUE1_9ACTN|nr:S8 family peptidase [Micromonospora coxensis]SCG37384.1 Peptidase inhibitor I9 [Micromonospora coxensis]
MSQPFARRLRAAAAGLLTVTMVTAAAGSPATAAPAPGQIRYAGGTTAVPDSYIVVLKDRAVAHRADARTAATRAASGLASRYGATAVGHVYSAAIVGFEARLSHRAARQLAADPTVAYVEQNHVVTASDVQVDPHWNLDRIDQRAAAPLDARYHYTSSGQGVTAYILDTGIRKTHVEFEGRAVDGFDAIDGSLPADDCEGHGTHVAGTVGGRTYGVAKKVRLVSVRVLDCRGRATIDQVIAGIDWVTADHRAGEPAVANMSLGGSRSDAQNDAVTNSIADGVSYAIAAGNSAVDACQISPASTPEAITVGATWQDDSRTWFSNVGPCLDIFAPGVAVKSAYTGGDTWTRVMVGTSQAAPHVAGTAARVLSAHPSWTPAQVHAYLMANATAGTIPDPGPGSPNRVLYAPPAL